MSPRCLHHVACWFLCAVVLGGCSTRQIGKTGGSKRATEHASQTAAAAVTSDHGVRPANSNPADSRKDVSASPRTFGATMNADLPMTTLAEIAVNPTRYQGRLVRTEGDIVKVCQKRGCWMELRDKGGLGVFVPMAGHSFAVPKGSVGAHAVVQGTVARRERSYAERKHLEADGAGRNIPSLSIEANAVRIQ